MFMIDVETLGLESTAVVLSAAVIHFEIEDINKQPNVYYYDLLNKGLFVKFNAQEQLKKRSIDKDVISWWQKQSQIAKDASVEFYPTDVTVTDGITQIINYINDYGGNKTAFWQRGSLDQVTLDSLCAFGNMPKLSEFYLWRDVRTAIDILAENSDRGYCEIDGFDPGAHVYKHHPLHDCAYDILMLLEACEKFPPF